MTTTVLLFASVAEMAGTRRLAVDLRDGARVLDLEHELVSRYPKLEGLADRIVYALNEEYVDRDQLIRPGDTVAVIPPVSGG
jgi:molybdopterin converting factor subunit 1